MTEKKKRETLQNIRGVSDKTGNPEEEYMEKESLYQIWEDCPCKLTKPLFSTLFDPIDQNLRDAIADIADYGIDSILDLAGTPLLADIPIVKPIVGICKTMGNIHHQNLLRQTLAFLNRFNNTRPLSDKEEQHIRKLQENPKFMEEEMGRILLLLDSWLEVRKSEILAGIFTAYVNKEITWDEFCEFSEITSRILLGDLQVLKTAAEKNGLLETGEIPSYRVERLASLGLLFTALRAWTEVSDEGQYFVNGKYQFHLNELGAKYCSLVFD